MHTIPDIITIPYPTPIREEKWYQEKIKNKENSLFSRVEAAIKLNYNFL